MELDSFGRTRFKSTASRRTLGCRAWGFTFCKVTDVVLNKSHQKALLRFGHRAPGEADRVRSQVPGAGVVAYRSRSQSSASLCYPLLATVELWLRPFLGYRM